MKSIDSVKIIQEVFGQTPTGDTNVNMKIAENKEFEDKFDKFENCKIRICVLDYNFKNRIAYWNRNIHFWLKYYVHLRLIDSVGKTKASLITFIVSAFWHGFYPTYYIFFISIFILDSIADTLERKVEFYSYIEHSGRMPIKILMSFLTLFFLNYNGAVFIIINNSLVWEYLQATYFIGFILEIILFVYVTFILKESKTKLYSKGKEKKH